MDFLYFSVLYLFSSSSLWIVVRVWALNQHVLKSYFHRLFKPEEEKCLILIKIFCIKLYFDSDVLSCTEYFLQIYRDK